MPQAKAGVPFIFASYGFGVVESGQVATINSFEELTRRYFSDKPFFGPGRFIG
jgi:hypothetical protein